VRLAEANAAVAARLKDTDLYVQRTLDIDQYPVAGHEGLHVGLEAILGLIPLGLVQICLATPAHGRMMSLEQEAQRAFGLREGPTRAARRCLCTGRREQDGGMLSHPQAEALDEAQRAISGLVEQDEVQRQLLAQAACEGQGLAVVAFGARRLAVSLSPSRDGDVVGKVAWREAGRADNALEARFWDAAGEELRRLMAPTFGQTPGGANIQGRCLPVSPQALPKQPSLTRRLAHAGVTDSILNLGFYEGRLVCYDYAMIAPEKALALLSQRP
jgi:hypothetical protein